MYILNEKEMFLPMNLWSVTNFFVQVNFQTPFFLSITIIMESAKRIKKKELEGKEGVVITLEEI